MKRRHRKTVLDINGESDSPRARWLNERKYYNNLFLRCYHRLRLKIVSFDILAMPPIFAGQSQNGSPSNPLSNLITQYNSDGEGDNETKPRAHKLNDQVNDFLKVFTYV